MKSIGAKTVLAALDKSFERAYGMPPPPDIWPKWIIAAVKKWPEIDQLDKS